MKMQTHRFTPQHKAMPIQHKLRSHTHTYLGTPVHKAIAAMVRLYHYSPTPKIRQQLEGA